MQFKGHLKDHTTVDRLEGFETKDLDVCVCQNLVDDLLGNFLVHVVRGTWIEISNTVYNHLSEVVKRHEIFQQVNAGQGFVGKELQSVEGGPVQGGEKEVKGLLVLVAQQILLVPNMVFAGQAQFFQLGQIESSKWLKCGNVGEIARREKSKYLLRPVQQKIQVLIFSCPEQLNR